MKFDYGVMINSYPVKLSIGSLHKPTLKEIAEISFDKFGYFEFMLKLSPELFYIGIQGENGKQYWDSLSDEEKDKANIFNMIQKDEKLQNVFKEIFNFFFIENVVYYEDMFVLLKDGVESLDEYSPENTEIIAGVINDKLFGDVVNAIQQICCIADKEEDTSQMKFKNKLAEKLFKKMQAKKTKQEKKSDPNFELPNIISAVSNKHPTINPINVWDLTIFQLLDSFGRLQANTMFDIDSTRVSVWGDEKKTFNAALWYENHY